MFALARRARFWQARARAGGQDVDIKRGFAGTVGNTPLIRLNRLSEETGCEILGKAESVRVNG